MLEREVVFGYNQGKQTWSNMLCSSAHWQWYCGWLAGVPELQWLFTPRLIHSRGHWWEEKTIPRFPHGRGCVHTHRLLMHLSFSGHDFLGNIHCNRSTTSWLRFNVSFMWRKWSRPCPTMNDTIQGLALWRLSATILLQTVSLLCKNESPTCVKLSSSYRHLLSVWTVYVSTLKEISGAGSV